MAVTGEQADDSHPRAGAPDVLVLRALGLGDLLTGVPALRALRRGLPAHRIVLAAPEVLRPLVALTGAVHAMLPTEGLRRLEWPVRPPAIAVNLHGRGPESHRLLLALAPGPLLAFANPSLPGVGGPGWDEEEHEVVRWCRLVRSYGVRADPSDLMLRLPASPSVAPGAVVVHPGAGDPRRRWPVDRYAAVARHAQQAGERVVVTGSADEAGLAVRVARQAGLRPDAVLAGRLGLGDLAALVSTARLVVAGDTGIAHLATAYCTPSVLLFGPTPPAQWGPPPERRQHIVLWKGPAGLAAIGVAEVVAAVDRALDHFARELDVIAYGKTQGVAAVTGVPGTHVGSPRRAKSRGLLQPDRAVMSPRRGGFPDHPDRAAATGVNGVG